MTLGELLKQYRTQHDITMDDFAKRSGISKGYISMLEKNQNPRTGKPIAPSLETIRQVAHAMGEDLNSVLAQLDDGYNVTVNKDIGIDAIKNLLPLPPTTKLPLIGTIACGTPILAEENIEDYLSVPERPHADFCLRCSGDSMVNARILDGDIVLIRKQPDVDDGQIAAVLIDDEATLKRVYHNKDGGVTLVAENPAYAPMTFTAADCVEVRILGRAVAFLSDVK